MTLYAIRIVIIYDIITLQKHERLTRLIKAEENTEVVKKCVCYCGKEYKHMSSLCKHKQKCNISNPNKIIQNTKPINEQNNDDELKQVLMEVVKQNNEFKELLIEQNKQIIELSSKPTTTNMNNIISNYSNTIFYKIYCKDENIADKYIGHTTNFVQRQKQHKRNCINPKSVEHYRKLYKFIRDNNGWDNWNMKIIAFHECENLLEARKYEQQYFEEHNATLNCIEPLKINNN